MIDLTDTVIRVDGDPADLTTDSEPVVRLAALLCTAPTTRPCYQCRGLAYRLLLIGDVRIEARS